MNISSVMACISFRVAFAAPGPGGFIFFVALDDVRVDSRERAALGLGERGPVQATHRGSLPGRADQRTAGGGQPLAHKARRKRPRSRASARRPARLEVGQHLRLAACRV